MKLAIRLKQMFRDKTDSRSTRSVPHAFVTVFCAAMIVGCGSSSPLPSPTATPPVTGTPNTPTPSSALRPTPFVLSPDQDGGIIDPQMQVRRDSAKAAKAAAVTTATTSSPAIAHWFYLINGAGVPADQASAFTPNVLDLNGAAPNGAPNPNGGTAVNVVAMANTSTTTAPTSASVAQLWKAIAAPTEGAFYLRSAESFQINSATTAHAETSQPSALTGFGASFAALDLGSLPFGIGTYWNQEFSPSGDNSAFQQWTYDQNSGQLTNVKTGQQLYNLSSTGPGGLTMGQVSASSSSEWYAYPSYYLDGVINQAPVAFPAFTGGEAAAYEWFSAWVLAVNPTPSCRYSVTSGGQTLTTFSGDGVRCQFGNVGSESNLTTCQNSARAPEPQDATTNPNFTSTDWTNMAVEMAVECQYAADVQTVWGNYTTIMTDVFLDDNTLVPGLVSDVVGSENPTLHPVAADLIEGTLYTLLGLTGDPGAGAIANMMSMATNAAIASNSDSATSLKTAITTTAADLYSDLAAQFKTVNAAIGSSETSVLEDWGKLQVVGPLALRQGYNGLSLSPSEISGRIEPELENGYQLYVMQQLMQVSSYELNSQLATTISPPKSMPSGVTSSTWAQYTSPTFGTANAANQNVFWFQTNGDASDNDSPPTQKVMQTDILDAGASPFEVFNGLNGWAAQPMIPNNPLGCGIAVTLFNATPNDLSVGVTPSQGIFAAPGSDFEPTSTYGYVGFESPYSFELRPYGYLPIYAAANPKNLTMDVNIYDFADYPIEPVAEFTFGSGNCDSQSVWNIVTQNSYSFSPSNFNMLPPSKDSGANGGGIWATIYQN